MSPTATADMPEATGATSSAQVANFLDEMQALSARIIAEPIVLLEPMVLDVLADVERVARLRTIAAESAGCLIPDPALHLQMNRLLDEMGAKTEPWAHSRSAVSYALDADTRR